MGVGAARVAVCSCRDGEGGAREDGREEEHVERGEEGEVRHALWLAWNGHGWL